MYHRPKNAGMRQLSSKKMKAHLLKKQDRLLREMMEITYIIAIPRLFKNYKFYDTQRKEYVEMSDYSLNLINTQEFKWNFCCYRIGKEIDKSHSLHSWAVKFDDPVKFHQVTKTVWDASTNAMDELHSDSFVAEAWIITLGDEPSDEEAMTIFEEHFDIFNKEKANWELRNEYFNKVCH